MEKERRHVTKDILNLTLEIIYLLTGEDYVPLRKSDVHITRSISSHQPRGRSGSHSPITYPPSPSLILANSTDQKILEVTQKIIELLTGEVPIRCQDVTVYFSMEEWEYVEGHKDLYKDIMMKNRPHPHIKDLNRKDSEVESHTLCSLSPHVNSNKTFMLNKTSLKSCSRKWPRKRRLKWIRKTKARPGVGEKTSTLLDHEWFQCASPIKAASAACSTDANSPVNKGPPDLRKIEHFAHGYINVGAQTQPISKKIKAESCSATAANTDANSPVNNGPPALNKFEHFAQEDINLGAQTQPISKKIKAESYSATAASLSASDIFEPTEYMENNVPSGVNEDFGSYLTSCHQDLYEPTDHPQHIIKEEPESCDEDGETVSQSKDDLCTGTYYTQSESNSIKEEPDLFSVSHINVYDLVDPEQYRSGFGKMELAPHEEGSTSTESLQRPCSTTEPRPKQCTTMNLSTRTCMTTNLTANQCTTIDPSATRYMSTECSPRRYTARGHTPRHCENTDHAQRPLSNITEEAFSDKESGDVYTPIEYSQMQYALVQGSLNDREKKHYQKRTKELSIANGCDYNKIFCEETSPVIHQTSLASQTSYVCSVCEKSFTSSFGLVRHQTVHNGNKVACPQCGKLFFYKSSLLIHQRIHTGEKLFGCHVCGKSFTNNSNLIVHQRIHTGEKPFSCLVCGKRFGHKGHLNRHARTHATEKATVDEENVGDDGSHSWTARKTNHQSLKVYDTSTYSSYKRYQSVGSPPGW